jgi:hypothetical protein
MILALVGALSACKSTGAARPTDSADADDDAALDATFTPDSFECNPCFEVCACTLGDTFVSPRDCRTYICEDGAWGGMGCVGRGCDDASVDDSSQGDDATGDDAMGDDAPSGDAAASDAPGDTPIDAPPDRSGDASADVAGDGEGADADAG